MNTALETCVKNAFKLPVYPDFIQDVIRNRMIEHEAQINRGYLHGDNSWARRSHNSTEVCLNQEQSPSRRKINEWIIALEPDQVFSNEPIKQFVPASTVCDHFRRLINHGFLTDTGSKGYNGVKLYYQTSGQKILHKAYYADG